MTDEKSVEELSRERLQGAVGSDFRVGRLVGRGGFAEVFEAEDFRLSRKVAIKVVRPAAAVSGDVLQRFQREARAMAGLRHPHVMEVYTVGEAEGLAYFIMPLIEGESLKRRIERLGALPLQEVSRILIEAGGALAAAHRAGTIHRDVKPDNILLEGEAGRVLITDFGIAKALEADTSSVTRSGVVVGTPSYMSPEQAAGEPVDHRSDIYSLGVVAFEMVTGRPPFQAKSVQAMLAKHLTEAVPPLWTLRPDCPERLGRVVELCLAKDPGDRWESLVDMVAVLEGTREPDAGKARTGVAILDVGRARSPAGSVPVQGDAAVPVRTFRQRVAVASAGLATLAIVDVVAGFGGVSAWAAVPVVGYFAARAGRLWRAGYEWQELVRGQRADPAGGIRNLDARSPDARGDTYGRFSSLVRACASDRATIMKAFASLPHQEQRQVAGLQAAVEGLADRVRHLARRIVGIEARIAETAARASAERAPAGLLELNAIRDDAAAELRSCVARLGLLRERVIDDAGLDPARTTDGLARALSDAAEYLASRVR